MYRNYSIEKKIKYISAFASNGFCVFSSEKKISLNLRKPLTMFHLPTSRHLTDPTFESCRTLHKSMARALPPSLRQPIKNSSRPMRPSVELADCADWPFIWTGETSNMNVYDVLGMPLEYMKFVSCKLPPTSNHGLKLN